MITHIQQIAGKIFKGESLKARLARGGIWLGIGGGAEQGLRFIRNIVLARILAPEAFGIMAIVLAVTSAFDAFTQIGIKEAVIQNPKGSNKTFLNGAWWLAVGRSAGLVLVGMLIAPWVASFYGSDTLVPMLRVSMLTILFNGLFSVNAFVALKKMKYFSWAVIQNFGGIVGVLLSIVLSVLLKSAWALVYGFLAEAFLRCLLSYLMCPFAPSFSFDKDGLRDLFKFAQGMFGLPLLYFIYMRIDVFVLGKMCSKSDLGLYSMAATLAQLPVMFIAMFLEPTMLPVFSELKDQKDRFNNAILSVTELIALACIPMFFTVLFYAPGILACAYGAVYASVATAFAILFGASLIRIVSVPLAAVYFAIGHPKLNRYFTIVRVAVIAAIIYPLIHWLGLTGAAIAGFVSMMVSHMLQVARTGKMLEMDVKKYCLIFVQAIGVSIPIALVSIISRFFLPPNGVYDLLCGMIGLLFSYGIVIVMLRKKRFAIGGFRHNDPLPQNE